MISAVKADEVLGSSVGQDLLSLPVGDSHRRAALTWAAAAALLFVVVLPFGGHSLSLNPGLLLFGVAALTAIGLCSLIISNLLFRQFAQIGRLRLLLLAYAYYLYGLLSLAQVAAYPWPDADHALGGAQASPLLWASRHAIFAVLFLAVGIASRGIIIPLENRALVQNGVVFGAPLLVASLLVTFASAPERLPALLNGNDFTPLYIALIGFDWLIGIAALFIFISVSRLRGTIQIWFSVALLAFLADVSMRLFFPGRGTVGAWVALIESAISSLAVL